MQLILTTPFTMTREVAELIWGQVLKDVEHYDQRDAARFKIILEELGYKPEHQFMVREFQLLTEVAEAAKPAEEAMVPHHYLASLYGGTGAIYVSYDMAAARREAELDAGRGNLSTFRQATENEVEWFKAMNGRIQVVGPVPSAASAPASAPAAKE